MLVCGQSRRTNVAVKRLFLLPSARGLGLGRRMTEAVIKMAKEIGDCELRLDTPPTMTEAINLYEQIGFERIIPSTFPAHRRVACLALGRADKDRQTCNLGPRD